MTRRACTLFIRRRKQEASGVGVDLVDGFLEAKEGKTNESVNFKLK